MSVGWSCGRCYSPRENLGTTVQVRYHPPLTVFAGEPPWRHSPRAYHTARHAHQVCNWCAGMLYSSVMSAPHSTRMPRSTDCDTGHRE